MKCLYCKNRMDKSYGMFRCSCLQIGNHDAIVFYANGNYYIPIVFQNKQLGYIIGCEESNNTHFYMYSLGRLRSFNYHPTPFNEQFDESTSSLLRMACKVFIPLVGKKPRRIVI